MTAPSFVQQEIRSRLGHDATDEAVWQDTMRFVAATMPIAAELWQLDARSDLDLAAIARCRDDDAGREFALKCGGAAEQLGRVLGRAVAGRCGATTFLNPQLWAPAFGYGGRAYHRRRALEAIVRGVASAAITLQPPVDWVRRVARRIYDLCTVPELRYHSRVAECIVLLMNTADPDAPGIAALLDALTLGEWAIAWQQVCTLAERPVEDHCAVACPPWGLVLPQELDDEQVMPSQQLRADWQNSASGYAVLLLARLDLRRLAALGAAPDAESTVDMALLRRVLEALPSGLQTINHALGGSHSPLPGPPAWSERTRAAPFVAQLRRLEGAIVWDLVCDLRAETWPLLSQVHSLRGGRYLLRLAEEITDRGLRRLPPDGGRWHHVTSVDAMLSTLLVSVHLYDDDRNALVALLRQLPVTTLLALLPLARDFEREICAALGWDGTAELLALLRQIQAADPARSTDPRAGIISRDAVIAVVEQLGEEHARILFDALARHLPAAVLLAQAVLGWNRADVRRMVGRRNPLAVRALALLPLEKPDDLLKRYRALATFEREANASAPGRKAAERSAAQAALHTLALSAGYADATRLEWAMQAVIGAQGVNLERTWEIEGYELRTLLRDGAPVLEVRRGARVLKRVPAAVSRDYAYREVRATLELLKDQQRRFRDAFLNAMRRGEALSPDELDLLRANPLATALLERLVLRTADGVFGLYRAADHALEGYHEERVRVEGDLFVAHAYDLAQAQLLADWQAEVVRRQLVQPFKQVFRELYVLTPAEASAVWSSGRMAGRHIKGRQSTAVLANLGWEIGSYEGARRPFYEHGFSAVWETTGSWYGDYDGGALSGALYFAPLPGQHARFPLDPYRRHRVPLADVPPLVLSEVLRDIDLVTVVAHGDEDGSSREVLERRADLVRATAAALGLRSVTVETPHVHVQGSRASYRIHLATAAIHIDSGAYLCIVPAAKTVKATYLPFAEGGDPVSTELISKVLMLANDQRITDPTILAQLPALTR